MTHRRLALLRGINVGGRNIIRMPDLRVCFERLGFTSVTTYIQSGNVLFDSTDGDVLQLAARIEGALLADFGCVSTTLVLTPDQMTRTVAEAPAGFGVSPQEYKYDVAFLWPSCRAEEILPTVSLKGGVDEAFAGNGALYFRRLAAKLTQSRLSRLTAHPAYSSMTVRNWNTTTKLHQLLGARTPEA